MSPHESKGARLCGLLLVLLLASGPVAWAAQRAALEVRPETWVVFAARDCPDCERLRADLLPSVAARDGPGSDAIGLVDIEADGGFELLLAIEGQLGTSGERFPALLAGKRLAYGLEQIEGLVARYAPGGSRWRMPAAVCDALNASGLVGTLAGPSQAGTDPTAGEAAAAGDYLPADAYREATVLLFTTPGCSACSRARTLLKTVAGEIPGARVSQIDVSDSFGRALQLAATRRLEVRENRRLTTPLLVSGSDHLARGQFDPGAVRALLQEAPSEPFWATWNEARAVREAHQTLRWLADRAAAPAVLLAGLIDGVNPCAFAVIVFLVSYLTLTGGTGRQRAFLLGLCFCAGVFVCYLLIGLGFVQLAGHLQAWHGLFRALLGAMAALCLLFALGAGWDIVRARRGGVSAMRFGIPKPIQSRIHALIRHSRARKALYASSFALGLVVSSLELVCTGQIYLPVLMYINAVSPGFRSLSLLLLYNLAFVVPLLAVLVSGVYGAGSQALAAWGRRHAAAMRALAGAFSLLLGILLATFAAF